MRRRWTLELLENREVPTFYGNQLFPLDNPWNQNIAAAPVAANSAAIINRIIARHDGTAPRIHADFGNPSTDGALYGIPINVVDGSVAKKTIFIPNAGYADESDPVQVPIPSNAVIEGDGPTGPRPPGVRGDSHLLVYDQESNVLYELYQAIRPSETSFPYGGTKPVGQWGAYQVSYWDLNTNHFRTIGATSADAAGLPILPGLVRPDEALPVSEGGQGAIHHAIRMTVQQSRDMFVFPASHEASSLSGSDLPRMGERFRLKASYVIPANWSPEAKAIAQAMKDYGMIVADNGSDMYFTGTGSTQWNMSSVLQVQQIRASDFEVVDLTPVVTGLSVTSGPVGGGTSVIVSGYNFGGSAGQLHVLFGTVEATSVTVLSDTQLIAISPAHAAGTVDVRVRSGSMRSDTNDNQVFFGYGTSAVTPAGEFTFDASPADGPPMANADSFTVVHDRTLTVGPAGVLGNDTSDPVGRPLTATLVNGPAHGTLTLNPNGSFTYRPAAGYVGPDSFTYTARDGDFISESATVSMTVTDQAPVVAGDAYRVARNKTLTVPAAGVLANDADADGDALTAVVGTGPANGTLTLNPNGSFSYTPASGFSGMDTFTYRANDSALDSAPATVTITVLAPPRVKSVVFNDGSAQRSLIRSVTITFDSLVTFDARAIRVVRYGGGVPTQTRTVTNENGETTVVITFRGGATKYGSLIDGRWVVRVFGARVRLLDDPTVQMGADSLTKFHRFFGDADGDRDVDASDKAAFEAAFGQIDAASLATFDCDNDGDVDVLDRIKFNGRYRRRI
jgi:hypothetical protein